MAQEGYMGALRRLDQVLHKLKDCFAELSEIERIVTEMKPDAHGDDMEAVEERPDLLLVAGNYWEMVNSLKAGLERISDMRRVQVAVPTENNASEEDINMRSRPSPVLDSATQAEANKVNVGTTPVPAL